MIIDRSHRSWMLITAALFILATALYVIYVRSTPEGPSAGSWPGLAFGVVGSVLMIFAGLLSSRKKVPRWQIGSAQWWLKGHIWFGLLSVPLIFFHAGFRFGGLLTQLLMAAFLIVTVSGIFGLVLQHYLPRMMKTSIPAQAIFEQVPQACGSLRSRCDEAIVAACGTLFQMDRDQGSGGETDSVSLPEQYDPEQELREFYLRSVRPFLNPETTRSSKLSSTSQATALFAQVQDALPENLHEPLAKLESACDERRQLQAQLRIHHWLHGWLFMHVPLSMFMLVLGIAHVVWTTFVY